MNDAKATWYIRVVENCRRVGRASLSARRGNGALVVLLACGGASGSLAQGALPGPPSQPVAAAGQLSQTFKVDDGDPEDSVPDAVRRDANPLEYGYFVQDLLDRAELSRKKDDYEAVVRYYRAVVKAVPDRAKGWSKLCAAYETLGDRQRAVRACKLAIARAGVEIDDYVRYVRLLTGAAADLTSRERTEVDEVLAHLANQPAQELLANHLRCDVAVTTKNVSRLRACTAALAKLAPDDPKTLVYKWTLAVQTGDHQEAERLIQRTQKLGVVLGSNIERMQAATASLAGPGRPGWPTMLLALTLIVLGALSTLAIRAMTRRRFFS